MHRDISSNGHKSFVWIVSLCRLYASLLRHYIDTIEQAFAWKDTSVSYSCKNCTVFGEKRETTNNLQEKLFMYDISALLISSTFYYICTYTVRASYMKCSSRMHIRGSIYIAAPTSALHIVISSVALGIAACYFDDGREIQIPRYYLILRDGKMEILLINRQSSIKISIDNFNISYFCTINHKLCERFYRESRFKRSYCQ